MNIKLILNSLIRIIILLFICSLVITLFSFLNILGDSSLNIIKLIIMLGSFFYGGFYLGTHIKEKGALHGILLAISLILISLFISVVFKDNIFSISSLIYKLISFLVIISSMILGIKIKK